MGRSAWVVGLSLPEMIILRRVPGREHHPDGVLVQPDVVSGPLLPRGTASESRRRKLPAGGSAALFLLSYISMIVDAFVKEF